MLKLDEFHGTTPDSLAIFAVNSPPGRGSNGSPLTTGMESRARKSTRLDRRYRNPVYRSNNANISSTLLMPVR
jgi:hypothetical protein